MVALIVVAAIVLILLGSVRINKDYDVQVASITIPTDQAAVERGRHFVETIGLCSVCHGDGLGGDIMSDSPLFGTLAPPNLTSGVGGIAGELSDEDSVRAISYGIGLYGEALVIKPSQYFNKTSAANLWAVIT